MFVFGVILIRIQSECGKIRTRITPNTDTFCVVLSCLVTGEAFRIYQFITNNYASFYLLVKENLLNCKIISKYYKHDCLQNFHLLFMSLLTSSVVQNSHISAGIYFIFLKRSPRPNLKGFQFQIWTLVKRSGK